MFRIVPPVCAIPCLRFHRKRVCGLAADVQAWASFGGLLGEAGWGQCPGFWRGNNIHVVGIHAEGLAHALMLYLHGYDVARGAELCPVHLAEGGRMAASWPTFLLGERMWSKPLSTCKLNSWIRGA